MPNSVPEITPLTPQFGAIVHDVNLEDVTATNLYPEIRSLFEDYSLLLFRGQMLSDEAHVNLARLFGPLEERSNMSQVWRLSNEAANGGVTDAMDLNTLALKSNQFWHVDSSYMPTPSLCNILAAKVLPTSGGETEFASTRAAYADMPDNLKARIEGKVFKHHYRTSRDKISKELADLPMYNQWPAQHWPAVLVNPVNAQKSVYVASHVFEVEGMSRTDSEELVEELVEFCTQEKYCYKHSWSLGDVLIWDQRAIMHRGHPWPYEEPRALASVCVSMTKADGIAGGAL